MSNDDELLIMPNQIPPECIKAFEELSGLDATPAEILAGAINAWPMAVATPRPYDLILPLQEPRT
jgi:hypothetical protein